MAIRTSTSRSWGEIFEIFSGLPRVLAESRIRRRRSRCDDHRLIIGLLDFSSVAGIGNLAGYPLRHFARNASDAVNATLGAVVIQVQAAELRAQDAPVRFRGLQAGKKAEARETSETGSQGATEFPARKKTRRV